MYKLFYLQETQINGGAVKDSLYKIAAIGHHEIEPKNGVEMSRE